MTATSFAGDPTAAIPEPLRGEIRTTWTADGAALRYRYWPGQPGGDAAVYLHGIAGHSLWFSAAASQLAAAGVTVYGPDRRGSGLNDHLPAGHLRHHQIALRDARHFVDLARAHQWGGRLFLIAGCWGAKLGAVFAAREGRLLDGLALVAPALSVRITLPRRDLLGVAASLLLDQRNRFPIPLRPEQYTDNPRFRTFIERDPDRLLTATARFYFETARLDRLASRAPGKISLPVLVQAGERDEIVDTPGLRRWCDQLGSSDRTLCFYPDYAHILEFEARPEAYLRDLLSWFERQRAA
jgi:acylglycerol lipase